MPERHPPQRRRAPARGRTFLGRRFAATATAAFLGLFAVSCSDGPTEVDPGLTNPIPPPSFGPALPGNGLGLCMFGDAQAAGYAQAKLQCTAEDIDIAEVNVTMYRVYPSGTPEGSRPGFVALPPGGTIECLPGQDIDVDVDVVLENNAQARYDIGMWINPDPAASDPTGEGAGANTGAQCLHYNLIPGQNNSTSLDNTPDQCGDMAAGVLATVPLDILTFSCVDPDMNGSVDLDACTAWENNTTGANEVICPLDPPGGTAGFRQGTTPGTGSKCKCGQLGLPINIKSVLRIEKQTIPDGDAQSFDFTPTGYGAPFSLSDGQTNTSAPIDAGTYDVAETVPTGWNLTSIVCSKTGGGATPYTVTGNSVEVELGQADDVTCVFTNTKRGTIIVEKQTLPDGDPQSFTFTGDVAGSLSDGQTAQASVAPGSYSSTETVPAGWDLTNITCDDTDSSGNTGTGVASFVVAAGETVKCTFTNTKRGKIIVEKQTDPDGSAQSFVFTGDAAGSISDGGTIEQVVVPGTYSSTETVPTGWALQGISCDDANSSGAGNTATFNVEPGETVKCTFNNTQDAVIIVEKQTIPDGDGQSFTFTGDVSGSLSDGQTAQSTVPPGTYSSTETVPAGWDLTNITCDDANSSGNTGTGVATFNAEAGETVKCTFTNTKRGRIRVAKETLPDGDAQSFTFTGDASGSISDGQTSSWFEVAPGTYSSTETVPAGWDLTNITCSDANSSGNTGTGVATFNVEAGEDVTCTFTNTKRGSIQVAKETLPDGDPQSFTFTGDVGGSLSDGQSSSQVEVVPGSYSSTETVPAGWDLTSIVCSDANSSGNTGTGVATFNVEPGEDVLCTFTNTKRGSIQIAKETVPDGDPTSFVFTGDIATSLSDGQSSSQVEVVPGSYSSTETVPAEWDLTSIVCSDANSSGAGSTANFNVEPGEDVLCTFTNKRKPRLIVTKTIVGGGTQIFDFSRNPGGASFSLTDGGSNDTGYTLSPNTYTVCELDLAVAWSATATVNGNPATLVNPDLPQDLGNRCVDITLNYGDVGTVAWTNRPPPEGDARTIGYWKNWSSCSGGRQYEKAVERNILEWTLDGNLPQLIGDLLIEDCLTGVAILDKSDVDSGRKRANDAAYNLASQLLAYRLNQSAGAYFCTEADAAATSGQALLDAIDFDGTGQYLRPQDGSDYTNANNWAAILDQYNNNTLSCS